MKSADLQLQLNSNGIHIGERVKAHIDRGMTRLDSWTKKFPTRHARIQVSRRERDGTHLVELVLELPQKTIVASEEVPSLVSAVDRAFRKATRQLREFKAVLRRDHLHSRVREARNEVPGITESEISAAAQRRDLEQFKATAHKHVSRLGRFLRGELRSLQCRTDPVRLSIQDLVEESLAEALERFDEKPVAMLPEQWLYGVALDVLERSARKARREQQTELDPIEADPEPVPRDLVEDLLDEYLGESDTESQQEGSQGQGWSQRPADEGPEDPSVAAERHELEERVAAVLGELPRSWRRSFALHFVEGFDHQEIAQIQNLSEAQVRFQVQSAELFVRERLGELALKG